MEIGTVKIDSRLALAPMAGVTDAAFRQVCAELGAGLTYTELVSGRSPSPPRSSAATSPAWRRPPRSP